jgi:hypothetical protein
MRWPKEEGSDFAGHEMAKREGPKSPPPLGKEIGLKHFSTTPHPIVEK